MPRAILTTILILLGTSSAFSQQSPPETTATRCSFSDLYKPSGWDIPGLLNAKAMARATYTNVPGVFVTQLSPAEPEASIMQVGSAASGGRIEIDDAPIRILKLRAWEYGGKVFAYSLEYELQAIDHGKRIALGGISAVIYYDTDSSGLFKVRRAAPKAPYVPDMPPSAPKIAAP